jgi:hypothetical protein
MPAWPENRAPAIQSWSSRIRAGRLLLVSFMNRFWVGARWTRPHPSGAHQLLPVEEASLRGEFHTAVKRSEEMQDLSERLRYLPIRKRASENWRK